MQKIYVDLGANVGESILQQSANLPDHTVFAFEPNPTLLPSLHASALQLKKPLHVIWGAAWIADGELDLFMSSRHRVINGAAGQGNIPAARMAAHRLRQADTCAVLRLWALA